MIIPDINLLIFAYSEAAPEHRKARAWWETTLNRGLPVRLPWAVMCGFVRLMTHPSVLVEPLRPERAFHHVRSWLDRSNVEVIVPGPRHLEIDEAMAAYSLMSYLGGSGDDRGRGLAVDR